jgi:hypothetical protein
LVLGRFPEVMNGKRKPGKVNRFSRFWFIGNAMIDVVEAIL